LFVFFTELIIFYLFLDELREEDVWSTSFNSLLLTTIVFIFLLMVCKKKTRSCKPDKDYKRKCKKKSKRTTTGRERPTTTCSRFFSVLVSGSRMWLGFLSRGQWWSFLFSFSVLFFIFPLRLFSIISTKG